MGQAVAVKLGLQLLTPEEITKPTLFYEGLGRVEGHKRVSRAIAEWADGDAIAAHYGYGMDYFCTEDEGRNAHGPSVLDATNRAWLQGEFGIKFVSLDEIAALLE